MRTRLLTLLTVLLGTKTGWAQVTVTTDQELRTLKGGWGGNGGGLVNEEGTVTLTDVNITGI